MDQPDGSKFTFKRGPLLNAIVDGTWVILKNLNMAPQNVLEGMNSIFDHRQEIFVPELNETFRIHKNCKIFGVQNPMSLGGGRKGLPASFLNRFVKVNYHSYDELDFKRIVE
jgi:midasin